MRGNLQIFFSENDIQNWSNQLIEFDWNHCIFLKTADLQRLNNYCFDMKSIHRVT
jgi:hypothetical protein